ncbi:Flp pilus assembly protein CpaB [Paraburkholderia rhizosphaerae]|uniref:Pilus assembly protein CpaB n=1 Tax=Paraburkholderia rhizosphaerae TaxID=480658 RepID=A0A4R8M2A4_9BURK|nr:Flp pilus assembly protein CpaB [Paraburkholderia rhizosphaerae]TDY54558.1 pilus assembly protein CpaB [Paraburkholderia rhizosphaerae]
MLNKIRFRSLFGNAWIVLLVAVLIAGALTFFVYRYLVDHEARLKAEIAGRQTRAGVAVVVPNRDVPAGTLLSSDDFVSRDIAADLVYDDMIRVADFDAYRASRLVRAVLHGRPLRTGDIDALRGRDFSDTLPAGQRALTLEIDTINSTASLARPGNRVDIYWVGTSLDPAAAAARQPDEHKVIRLLMPDVLILATGQDVRPRNADDAQDLADNPRANTNYNTVTVQVPAAEAARLALAQRVGSLRLILRNSDDRQAGLPVRLAEDDLFPAPVGPRNTPVVEIIAGGGGVTTVAASGVSDSGVTLPEARAAPQIAAPPASDQPVTSTPTSLYDDANAIARQLQQRGSRNAASRN